MSGPQQQQGPQQKVDEEFVVLRVAKLKADLAFMDKQHALNRDVIRSQVNQLEGILKQVAAKKAKAEADLADVANKETKKAAKLKVRPVKKKSK